MVSARCFCSCKTRWILAVNTATSEEINGNCTHSESALGPGFIHWRKQKLFPPSIHRAETFIPPHLLAGSHYVPVVFPADGEATPPSSLFFKNKIIREPTLCLGISSLIPCVSWGPNPCGFRSLDIGTAFLIGFSSGTSSGSPGLKSPFQDSTTENTPSFGVVCTSTTCVAYHEQRSKLKLGRMPPSAGIASIANKITNPAKDQHPNFRRIQSPPLACTMRLIESRALAPSGRLVGLRDKLVRLAWHRRSVTAD